MAAWSYGSDWRTVRAAILTRDEYLCQLRLPGCTTTAEHVDHIVPLAEGGARLEASNLRASCRSCNLRRSAGRTKALVEALEATGDAVPSRRW